MSLEDSPTAPNQMPLVPLAAYRSSARRAKVATWLLAISTILAAVALATDVYGISVVRQAIDGSLTDLEAGRFVEFAGAISICYLAAFLVTAVAFLAWLSRAIDNVPALGAGWPSASPRWAIAWWFVPFANLGMPYDVVRELRGRMRGDGRRRHPPLLLAWWLTFVGGEVLLAAAARMPSATLEQQSATFTVDAIGVALTVCAGVLAIFVVRSIELAATGLAATVQSGALAPRDGATDEWDAGGRRTGWRMRASWVGYVAITAASAVALAVPLLAPRSGIPVNPHQAPELEARLPDVVAGRSLARWSVRGEDYFLIVAGLGPSDLGRVKADLAQSGLTIEDVAMATARRADTEDPPYLLIALQARGMAAETIPDSTLIDHPEAGAFRLEVVGGKSVRRGTVSMIEQSEDAQGIPYLYDNGDIRYIVITDDPDWAADALSQLP